MLSHQLEECEWSMLVRAQAARLLTERGHDVTELIRITVEKEPV